MRLLYHHNLSPFARKVRLALHEKRLEVDERVQLDWHRDEDFLALNPAGEVPVLVEPEGLVISDSAAICEYLDEVYLEPALLPADPAERAETRRLIAWFDRKFNQEVTVPLAGEKLFKRVIGSDAPDSRLIRAGRVNIHTHLGYIAWLTERRKWLAGETMTLADLTAAAHISLVDYAGDVPWDDHPFAKDWYARIKSRPSFRPLLRDVIPGIPAPRHYADLDF